MEELIYFTRIINRSRHALLSYIVVLLFLTVFFYDYLFRPEYHIYYIWVFVLFIVNILVVYLHGRVLRKIGVVRLTNIREVGVSGKDPIFVLFEELMLFGLPSIFGFSIVVVYAICIVWVFLHLFKTYYFYEDGKIVTKHNTLGVILTFPIGLLKAHFIYMYHWGFFPISLFTHLVWNMGIVAIYFAGFVMLVKHIEKDNYSIEEKTYVANIVEEFMLIDDKDKKILVFKPKPTILDACIVGGSHNVFIDA